MLRFVEEKKKFRVTFNFREKFQLTERKIDFIKKGVKPILTLSQPTSLKAFGVGAFKKPPIKWVIKIRFSFKGGWG